MKRNGKNLSLIYGIYKLVRNYLLFAEDQLYLQWSSEQKWHKFSIMLQNRNRQPCVRGHHSALGRDMCENS
jgi:hypothetical protein